MTKKRCCGVRSVARTLRLSRTAGKHAFEYLKCPGCPYYFRLGRKDGEGVSGFKGMQEPEEWSCEQSSTGMLDFTSTARGA